ncbi:kyphoscoliosis peptidase-like, partial [Scleropages formosus]
GSIGKRGGRIEPETGDASWEPRKRPRKRTVTEDRGNGEKMIPRERGKGSETLHTVGEQPGHSGECPDLQQNQDPETTSKPDDQNKQTAQVLSLAKDVSQVSLDAEGALPVYQEWHLEVLERNSAKKSSPGGPGGMVSRRTVFEKWTDKEKEAQRPSTKRQLSAESATHTVRVVKKATIGKEEHTPRQVEAKLQDPPTAGICGSPMVGGQRRKKRKDLFSSTEIFREVDTLTINTGKELRAQRVFSVPPIAKAITRGSWSKLENLRAIWVWLCHNIEYDLSGYLGLSEKLCSPEQVIEAGRGVCCGYSRICLEMCREVGIECHEVSGHGKGIGYQQGQSFKNIKSNHMWNAVELGGCWYLLDACWGAGKVDMENKTYRKRFDDFYFLTDPEDFIDSHYPDDPKWQLLECPIPLKEFETRVFKTSEFYGLGLKLQHPTHFHLVTERGEATVSLSSSSPAEFTYQISQKGDGEFKDISSSFGLLTANPLGMNLRLLPPTHGTYDIMVFARPANSTDLFRWVCSFLLECPEPRASEELPENPFVFWGLQPNASSLGLEPCSHGAEPILVEAGSLELQLKTSRPLMMISELSHRELDPALAKCCTANQIESDQLTCYVLCPYRGFYRLSLFIRDYEQSDECFQNAGNFLLLCQRDPVNLNQLFPTNLSSSCGPGIRTASAGLSKFSHPKAIINMQQGKCNITFHNSQDLDLHAVLSKEPQKIADRSLGRHVLLTYVDSKVTLSVTLPEAGVYRLGLYGKTTPGQEFSPLCDFILRGPSVTSWPPFPYIYTAWQRGCVLFEPRSGLLQPQSYVRFRVRVPGARKVIVAAEEQTNLQLNKSKVWEGEVFTGVSGSQLKLASSVDGEATQMAVLMSFDVLSHPQEE